MECACEINVDVYDGDYSSFQHSKMLKSFKDYHCDECNTMIIGGQEYDLTRGKFEGKWYTHRTCSVCLELRDKLFTSGHYLGLIHENILESLNENGCLSENCISELSPPARNVLCDLIELSECWEG